MVSGIEIFKKSELNETLRFDKDFLDITDIIC